MKIEGFSGELHPGITMHKIPVQAGFPGVIFTVGMLTVFLMGIPALNYFLLFATVLGIVFAVMLRFIPGEAGLVAFVFTAIIVVWLVGIPAVNDWRRGAEMELKDLQTSIPVPVPPPTSQYEPLPFKCDCHRRESKQPCDHTTQRNQDQKKPQPPSLFDGNWQGKMNDLPGVTLIVADAGGGQIGGVITFYFQTREDDSKWQVRGKFLAPLLAAQAQGKILSFEVQHHKTHGSPEFSSNVSFCMELAGENKAMLYNASEPSSAPVELVRRN
jgi:hypothetical protein